MPGSVVPKSPFSLFVAELSDFCSEQSIDLTAKMLEAIPKKWERYGDMLLLPETAFRSVEWRQFDSSSLWMMVAKCFKVNAVARKHRIVADDFRTPHVELLFGNSGWVEHKENGIIYQYDVTKCMFSRGNIAEKLRIANQLSCAGETVVDLFAGIGYFTLSYLVHAKAGLVYACEWNPDAIAALKRNICLNNVEDRCIVLEGDCRSVCLTNVSDHVNLGLLPSTQHFLLTACKSLKQSSGGILHIHENVTADSCEQEVKFGSEATSTLDTLERGLFAESNITSNRVVVSSAFLVSWAKIDTAWKRFSLSTAEKCVGFLNNLYDFEWRAEISYVGRVKAYAPRIDHLVLDCELRPV